ncbi:nitroreductase family protein [Mycolicibacterium sarraceniae]|uniref:Nitroreductase n=1 Tax=Mycolicibacterium sarraceniae TaxID=1534348 RepID=A0A7I7SX95_9MYCO|nr:nitroreductase family protein [Mycolicibacterium sarraceniae]BBY61418.1 nitroreductase [Mycolicibacterium sarraceniae]
MDLIDTLRSTGSVRDFTDEPVDDAALTRILDTARFAPSGANAQAWRVVVVKDRAIRSRLRDLYLTPWGEYLTLTAAGLRPWSPVNDRDEEAAALAAAADADAVVVGGMAAHLDEVPVLLAVFADLSQLAAVDRDLDRYSLAGGASVYPFAWSILLAARAEGLAGVLTTMLIRAEDEVKQLLGAGDPLVLAAVIALGHPVRQPRRLTRQPVASFTTVDRIDGETFAPDPD